MAQYVKNLVAGLSKRERRLAIATGLTFVAMLIFLFVFFLITAAYFVKGSNKLSICFLDK